MNLELIKEINDLKLIGHSYTEIAEITGISKPSIVISVRLHTLLEQFYSQQIVSLNNDINHLQESIYYKDTEIKRLNTLIVCNDGEIVIEKEVYESLKNELVETLEELDTLRDQLDEALGYLNNLSFYDKLKILFS